MYDYEAEREASKHAQELRSAARELIGTNHPGAAAVLRWHAIETMRPFSHTVMQPFGHGNITCKACGEGRFIDNGRSLDHNYWICAKCGCETSTLTETGMSA